MNILQVHNTYQDAGGEDVVVAREKQLLEDEGHHVSQCIVSNKDITSFSKKVTTAFSLSYSRKYKKLIKNTIKRERPDVVHVHNFLPILSPSIFDAARESGVPVILTLHNFRLLCVNGLLYRDHKVCEKCISKKFATSAIHHGCYQSSSVASAFPAFSNWIHTKQHTWQEKIDKVIFLTDFSRDVFDRSHLNFKTEQVTIKPNFVIDNGFSLSKEDYYLFVGRLSEEKGIRTVIKAFIANGKKLKIIGTGPLESEIRNNLSENKNIEVLGFQDQDALSTYYNNAQALITASKMYESFGLVIIEAFSHATPVIVPKLGNAATFIQDNSNGLLYEPSNAESLVAVIEKFESIENKEAINQGARNSYEESFTKDQNSKALIDIYKSVL